MHTLCTGAFRQALGAVNPIAQDSPGPAFLPASDSSLLVSFGSQISEDAQRRVAALAHSLERDRVEGVLNIHPAYCSVLIVFDPLRTSHDTVRAYATQRSSCLALPLETRCVEIPVCYGASYGPDLDALSQELGLHPERIVALHSSAEYVACFLGFVPGFAYLAGLPKELEAPRLSSPRHKVPPGSVGIAGPQTGIYAFETPGGWRLIGRTPATIFNAIRQPMSLIQLGDRVKFIPITADEFRQFR